MSKRRKVHCRFMIRSDMPEVFTIELQSFADPWTEEDFIKVLRQRNCIAMVAESGTGIIFGYVVYELLKDRMSILNIAVHPYCRRQSIGSQLFDKLLAGMGSRRTNLDLMCSEHNLGGQLFFSACGMIAASTDHSWFDDGTAAYKFIYRRSWDGPAVRESRARSQAK